MALVQDAVGELPYRRGVWVSFDRHSYEASGREVPLAGDPRGESPPTSTSVWPVCPRAKDAPAGVTGCDMLDVR
ncbi:hypothetical protein ACKUT9_23220 [Mycobacterium seoulense]|uniref:hypothetical protein n=1 Tax=Mycobacterium seoulense TaxID=386911 RepID=UPI003CF45E05